jgi:hypothetical protein
MNYGHIDEMEPDAGINELKLEPRQILPGFYGIYGKCRGGLLRLSRGRELSA